MSKSWIPLKKNQTEQQTKTLQSASQETKLQTCLKGKKISGRASNNRPTHFSAVYSGNDNFRWSKTRKNHFDLKIYVRWFEFIEDFAVFKPRGLNKRFNQINTRSWTGKPKSRNRFLTSCVRSIKIFTYL